MVSFSGQIKNEIQLNIMKLRSKQVATILVVFMSLAEVLGLTIAILWGTKEDLIEYLIYGVIILALSLIIVIQFKKKKLKFNWEYGITISEELITVVIKHQNNITYSKPLKKIKKVIDYGEYYYLFLHKWQADYGIVCQKDLLSQGTLEEFEKLFDGKIIRKIKGKS